MRAGEETLPTGATTGECCDRLERTKGSTRAIKRWVAWSTRAWARCFRCCWRTCWTCFIRPCQVCVQRSVMTALRKTSMGFTFSRFQCMPAPVSRTSTTNVVALSTMPEPLGHPAAWKAGDCMWEWRGSRDWIFCSPSRCPRSAQRGCWRAHHHRRRETHSEPERRPRKENKNGGVESKRS